MEPAYAHELIQRCKDNYKVIKKNAGSGYPITAILEALLIALIEVTENITKDRDFKKNIYGIKWPKKINEYTIEGKNRQVPEDIPFSTLIEYLRNSVAHHEYSYNTESTAKGKEITGIKFNVDLPSLKIQYFEFNESELVEFVDGLLELHKKFIIPIEDRPPMHRKEKK